MEMLDEIFIPNKEIKLYDELDYNRVEEYIYSAKAFSHVTYYCEDIINYFKHKKSI